MRNRLPEQFGGGRLLACFVGNHTEKMKSVRVLGIARKYLLIEAARLR